MDQVLITAMVRGLTSAAAFALFVWCLLPALVWNRARVIALFIGGAMGAAPALLLLAGSFVALPTFLLALAAYAVLLLIWIWPRGYVTLTGGPRSLQAHIAGVWSMSARIMELLDVGALDAAEHEAGGMELHRTPSTSRIIDLWHRRVDEEHRRRNGIEVSSRPTMDEIRAAWASLLGLGPARWFEVRGVLVIGLAGLIGMTSALIDGRACIGVERLILTATVPVSGGTLPLHEAVATDLEPAAISLYDEPMDLALAADSRHDPNTRQLLVEADFVGAHARGWTAVDGRRIQADVFEFADQSGAVRFQHAVNRYACRFANEAFDAPLGGIGLQVRRGDGDSIEEQVSWVVGSRRYLVSVRLESPPEDHARVTELVLAAKDASLR